MILRLLGAVGSAGICKTYGAAVLKLKAGAMEIVGISGYRISSDLGRQDTKTGKSIGMRQIKCDFHGES